MPRSKARQILRVCHPDQHHHSDRGYHSGTVVRGSIRSRQKMKLTKAVFDGTPVVIRFDPTACQTFKFGTIQCGRDFHGRYNADTNRWTVTRFKHSPLRVRFITIPQSGGRGRDFEGPQPSFWAGPRFERPAALRWSFRVIAVGKPHNYTRRLHNRALSDARSRSGKPRNVGQNITR